jgi:nucleoside-diphosphate-sugar epimerase
MIADPGAPARCLVMGGNRYIGLSLVFELARRGHDVTVMNSHPAPLPDGVRRLHGDRRQPGLIAEVLGSHRDEFDVVFDNTAYTMRDLEPMIELFEGRVDRFVFTSSVAVYQRRDRQPLAEDAPRHDLEDSGDDRLRRYGAMKAQCEDDLLERYRRIGFPIAVARVSHTLGPRSPAPSREPGVFARLEAGRPLLVPGEGFPFVHLIHIDDAATMLASLIGKPEALGQVYNAAGPEYASIVGHLVLMAEAVGVEPEIVHVPMALAATSVPPLVHWNEALTGGVVFDIAKACRELDWEPAFDLAAGYRDSYRWFSAEGRDQYQFDFSNDDRILAELSSWPSA